MRSNVVFALLLVLIGVAASPVSSFPFRGSNSLLHGPQQPRRHLTQTSQQLIDLLNSLNGTTNIPENLSDLLNNASDLPSANLPATVPVSLDFDTDCTKVVDNVVTQFQFKLALTALVAETLNINDTDITIPQLTCLEGGDLRASIGFLTDRFTEEQIKQYGQQLADKAQNIINLPVFSTLNINISGITATIGDAVTNVTDVVINIPTSWADAARNIIKVVESAVVRQVVPFSITLPTPCTAVATVQDVFVKYNNDLRQAVGEALNVTPEYINVTQVSCNDVKHLVAELELLVDNSVSFSDMVDTINNITKSVINNLPANFTDAYNITKDAVSTSFNLVDLDLVLPKLPVALTSIYNLVTPVRTLSLTADCQSVIRDASSESEFKAAMQAVIALGLKVPANTVNITRIACGSIITDYTVLARDSVQAAAVDAAATQLPDFIPSSVLNQFDVTDVRMLGGAGNTSPTPSPSPARSPSPSPTPSSSGPVASAQMWSSMAAVLLAVAMFMA